MSKRNNKSAAKVASKATKTVNDKYSSASAKRAATSALANAAAKKKSK